MLNNWKSSRDFELGFSADGSHCFSVHHKMRLTSQRIFNFVPGKGFPITNEGGGEGEIGGPCTWRLTYTVKELNDNPGLFLVISAVFFKYVRIRGGLL